MRLNNRPILCKKLSESAVCITFTFAIEGMLEVLLLAATISTAADVQDSAPGAKDHRRMKFEYSFPSSFTTRRFLSEIFFGPRDSDQGGQKKYVRVSIFQYIVAYLWDAVFWTDRLQQLLGTTVPTFGSHAQMADQELSSNRYAPELVLDAVEFSKLSFCNHTEVRDGRFFRSKKIQHQTLHISNEHVECFKSLDSMKFNIKGYILIYRDPANALKRCVVISYHAARRIQHIETTLMIGTHRSISQQKSAKIYLGWHAAMVELAPQIRAFMKSFILSRSGEVDDRVRFIESISSILFTGPCMGGVLAALSALETELLIEGHLEKLRAECSADAEKQKLLRAIENLRDNIHVYTFGAPRIGNFAFFRFYNAILGNKTFRIVNAGDEKPLFPFNRMGFYHVGQEVFFDLAHQVSGGQSHPCFQKASRLNEYGEDRLLGASGRPFRAILPYLEHHSYYFDRNIMCCFQKV